MGVSHYAFLWNIISCNLSQWHNTPPQTCNGRYFINPLSAVSPCTIVASSSQWVYIRKFSICTYSFLQHLVGKLPLRKAAERLSWAFYCDSFNKVDSSLDGWWFYSNKQERNQTFHSNQSVMHEWWEQDQQKISEDYSSSLFPCHLRRDQVIKVKQLLFVEVAHSDKCESKQ